MFTPLRECSIPDPVRHSKYLYVGPPHVYSAPLFEFLTNTQE